MTSTLNLGKGRNLNALYQVGHMVEQVLGRWWTLDGGGDGETGAGTDGGSRGGTSGGTDCRTCCRTYGGTGSGTDFKTGGEQMVGLLVGQMVLLL